MIDYDNTLILLVILIIRRVDFFTDHILIDSYCYIALCHWTMTAIKRTMKLTTQRASVLVQYMESTRGNSLLCATFNNVRQFRMSSFLSEWLSHGSHLIQSAAIAHMAMFLSKLFDTCQLSQLMSNPPSYEIMHTIDFTCTSPSVVYGTIKFFPVFRITYVENCCK